MSAIVPAKMGSIRPAENHVSQSSPPDIEAAFDQCSQSLYRYVVLRTGGDTNLADDIMQQVWLNAIGSDRSVAPNEMEFWLRRIAKNALNAHWRRHGRAPKQVSRPNPQRAAQLAEQLETEAVPVSLLGRKETQAQLLLALTELPTQEQDLIVQHYFHERSLRFIAESLHLSERGVEGRLYRARLALRQTLKNIKP